MRKKIKIVFGDLLINIAYWLAKKKRSKLFIWNLLFCFYKLLLSLFGMKILPVITIADYIDRTRGIQTTIKQGRKGLSICSTEPSENSPIREMDLHNINISVLNSVLITGCSDSIIDVSQKWIINDFCYNKSNNIYCSDSLLCREKDNWGLVRKVVNHPPVPIESGIMICGKFPHNYYHSLYENLNRCLLIDDNLIPEHVPILVDKVVLATPSLKRALYLLVQGVKRQIIPIESGKMYLCKSLYYIDHLNYIIPHHRKMSTLPNERSYYDPILLRLQREVLLTYKSDIKLPLRVFLTRANSASRLFNEEEIFNAIKDLGFVKVAPEKLTFEEQIALFNNADYIIGGSGAAFSNVIFCKPQCKIICFRPLQSEEGTPLFKTLAYITNADFWHYRADSIRNKSAHSNYYISPVRLKTLLNKLWNL